MKSFCRALPYACLALLLLLFSRIDSSENEPLASPPTSTILYNIKSTRYFESLNLTEIVLNNGMRVYLKPTDFETDEVHFRLSALGGFASLHCTDICSAQNAAQIAWESGNGDLTSDQVSVLLYEHSLEFAPKINAFSRTIEGFSNQRELGSFLMCVNMFFTRQNFTEEGMKIALGQVKQSIVKAKHDNDAIYEAEYLAMNTQGFSGFRSLQLNDIEKVDFIAARNFFFKSFSNPAEFVCVIVGNINPESVKPWIDKYLGEIPSQEYRQKISQPPVKAFPAGKSEKIVRQANRKDCLTRLTLPLAVPINEENLNSFEFATQVIEARIRKIFIDKMKISHGIDVAYEYPFYPSLENPWIIIQFKSPQKLVDPLIQMILAELKRLQASGVAQPEIDVIKKFQVGSDDFWLRENAYWAVTISNYLMWDWNLEGIKKNTDKTNATNMNLINTILRTYFSVDNYTIISSQPQ